MCHKYRYLKSVSLSSEQHCISISAPYVSYLQRLRIVKEGCSKDDRKSGKIQELQIDDTIHSPVSGDAKKITQRRVMPRRVCVDDKHPRPFRFSSLSDKTSDAVTYAGSFNFRMTQFRNGAAYACTHEHARAIAPGAADPPHSSTFSTCSSDSAKAR